MKLKNAHKEKKPRRISIYELKKSFINATLDKKNKMKEKQTNKVSRTWEKRKIIIKTIETTLKKMQILSNERTETVLSDDTDGKCSFQCT